MLPFVELLQGPFIVGVSFASEDINNFLNQRKELNITEIILTDTPAKGDASYDMCLSHGDQWCAWQEVWLKGLGVLNLVKRCT